MREQTNNNAQPRNRIFHEPNHKMVTGVALKFDTCLNVNDSKVNNQLYVIGENYIVFTAGSTVIIKDQEAKTQKIFSCHKKLRKITSLDAKIIDIANNKLLITVGESSPDDNIPIRVSLVFSDEGEWKFVNCPGIIGKLLKVQSLPEKRQTLGLVKDRNDVMEVYLWSYSRDKLLAKYVVNAKITVKDVCFHPRKPKNFLFFSSSHLRLWEYSQQGKTFVEGCNLVSSRIKPENKFVNFKFMNNKYFTFLLVLCKDNSIIWYQNEVEKRYVIKLDLFTLPFVVIEPKIFQTREVDETLGFGNVLEGKFEETVTLDEYGLDRGLMKNLRQSQLAEGGDDVPQDSKIRVFATYSNGFITGASGGLLCYFNIEGFSKIKEQIEKLPISNPQNYLIKGFFGKKLKAISTNKNLTTLIVKDKDEKLDYYLISEMASKDDLSKIGHFFRAGFHRQRIKALDTSEAKSFFISCGQDNIIRLYNYNSLNNEEKGGILYSNTKEIPLSVSLHPFGFFLAVAYSSGFKIFTLLKDNFFLLKEKNLIHCNHVQYSDGGQFIISSKLYMLLRFILE